MIYFGIDPGCTWNALASYRPDENQFNFHQPPASDENYPFFERGAIEYLFTKLNFPGNPMVDKCSIACFHNECFERPNLFLDNLYQDWENKAKKNGLDFFKITMKDIYQKLLKPNKIGDKVPDIRGYLDRRFKDIGERNYFQLRALIAAVCCSDMVESGELKLSRGRT